MATRPVSITKPFASGVAKAVWTAIATTDDGASADIVQYPDKTVQVLGTFAGGTVLIEGSNDGGTTYATLNAPDGTPLAFTAAGMKAIMENPQKIRPRASVAVTTVDVHIIAKS